jgi:hypothetical protein
LSFGCVAERHLPVDWNHQFAISNRFGHRNRPSSRLD